MSFRSRDPASNGVGTVQSEPNECDGGSVPSLPKGGMDEQSQSRFKIFKIHPTKRLPTDGRLSGTMTSIALQTISKQRMNVFISYFCSRSPLAPLQNSLIYFQVYFTFTKAGTPSSGETEKLLRVLGAEAQDQNVLRFWMRGLSSQCKQHIFSLNNNNNNNNNNSV